MNTKENYITPKLHVMITILMSDKITNPFTVHIFNSYHLHKKTGHSLN